MRGLEQIPWLYDTLCAVLDRLGLGDWRRWLVAGARGRTLDVGTGTGRNLPLYAPGVTPVGLEPAWDTLARARGPGAPGRRRAGGGGGGRGPRGGGAGRRGPGSCRGAPRRCRSATARSTRW